MQSHGRGGHSVQLLTYILRYTYRPITNVKPQYFIVQPLYTNKWRKGCSPKVDAKGVPFYARGAAHKRDWDLCRIQKVAVF